MLKGMILVVGAVFQGLVLARTRNTINKHAISAICVCVFDECSGVCRQFFHLRVHDAVLMEDPQLVTTHLGLRPASQSTLFRTSRGSSIRLWNVNTRIPLGIVQHVVQHWEGRYPAILPNNFVDAALCLRLPVPWAFLMLNNKWHVAPLPVLSRKERRRSGYASVPNGPFDMQPTDFDESQCDEVDLSAAQSCADLLRKWSEKYCAHKPITLAGSSWPC